MRSKLFLTSALLTAALFFASCKDNDNGVEPGNHMPLFSSSNIGPGMQGYDLFQAYDKSNLIGLVEFGIMTSNKYRFADDGTPKYTLYQATSFNLLANFVDSNKTKFVSFVDANIYANKSKLQEYALGRYYISDALGIENYFDGRYNTIQFDSNQFFNALKDSVTFSAPIAITNLPVGSTVSRNRDFNISFTGATNCPLIEYSLVFVDSDFNRFDTSRPTGMLLDVIKTTNPITVSANSLKLMKLGFYTLTVIAYEPKYVTTSNGKEICLLGTSIYVTTIQIID